MLSFFIVIPLALLLLLNLPLRGLMKSLALPAALLLSSLQAVLIALAILGKWNIYAIPASTFFKFVLEIDKLGLLLLLCNGIVMFIALLTARAFTAEGEQRFNLSSLMMITLSGMNGIAIVRDIFSLYVFLEVSSIASFILISFLKDKDAFEGAFKYILLSSIATVLMLSGIALLLLITGDTSFQAIKAVLVSSSGTSIGTGADTNSRIALFGIGIFLCGLFIKGGLVPFHGWLPDAYTAAPVYVSVLLAGITTKSLGIFTLMRMVYSVFGFAHPIKQALLVLGILSIVIGAVAALVQSDFKRMLAYSSISQVGYIMLGLGCGTALGIAAAALHFFNHAVFKSLLFVNAAALEKQTGTRDMDRLGGLAERMPLTGTASVIASLSAAGVPPLAGFWSKLLIIVALWSSSYYSFAVVAVLASVLTLAYMLFMQRRVFFGKLADTLTHVQEAGWEISLAATLLTLIIVGVGLLFPFNLCRLIIH